MAPPESGGKLRAGAGLRRESTGGSELGREESCSEGKGGSARGDGGVLGARYCGRWRADRRVRLGGSGGALVLVDAWRAGMRDKKRREDREFVGVVGAGARGKVKH